MTSGAGAVYEEAAVLYANGNVDDAEKILNAVLEDPVLNAGDGLWMMLLDLYRLTGQRQRFESRVLDYATRFERSPPPWEDFSSQAARPRGNTAPLVNLSGALDGRAAAQFEKIVALARKGGAIRIDLSRLRSVDAAGCALFLGLLRQLAADRVKVSVHSARQLAGLLAGQVAPGRAENRETWLLLLEMLQYGGEQERFEELAVDYAVTFEESPPSWIVHEQAALTETAVTQPDSGLPDTFRLEGDVVGAQAEDVRKLAAFATEHRKVDVDCSQLRRIDFVNAGALFNIFATLQVEGKEVTMRNVNAMVAALLRVMGVDQVAQITLRC